MTNDVPEVKVHSRSAGFSIISNNIFRDRHLSLKSKGLLCTMLSLPDNWDYSIAGLLKIINPSDESGKTSPIHGQSKDALYTILAELEERGYLIREQLRKESGRMGRTVYHVYDTPQKESADLGNKTAGNRPHRENPDTVNPDTDNPTQLNTKENKVLKESSSPKPPQLTADGQSVQDPVMKEFERLCELSIKPVRTQELARTKDEYLRRLTDGYTPEQIERAYKAYAAEYRERNSTPRYAKQLCDWLHESDGVLWYAPKEPKTRPIARQIDKKREEEERRAKAKEELRANDPSYAALSRRYVQCAIQMGKDMLAHSLSKEEEEEVKERLAFMQGFLEQRLNAYMARREERTVQNV